MEKELLKEKEAQKVTLVGFWVNTILAIGKIYAGIIGKSGAMIADGVHSFSDFLTDVVVIVGIRFSEKPEDECHNYGHGKYETLATVIISLFLVIVGIEIMKSGVSNILLVIKGQSLPAPGVIALIAAIGSIVSKELMYRYTIIVGEKIQSSSVKANAWHHRSDAFSSIGTLVGIGGAILLGHKWTVLDPIASMIVSIFIFKVAFDILKPAVNELMEKSLSEEEKLKIEEILNTTDEVKDFHCMRTRKIGANAVIEFHILVEKNLDVKNAHSICNKIEEQLRKVFGSSSILTIHVEPYEN